MRFGRYDLNKLSSKIIIHKSMDLIFIYKFFLSLVVNFLKLDFLKIIWG
jgi:hypothetical protein